MIPLTIAPPPVPTRMPSPAALFLRQFLRNPAMVGSVVPSSPWLVRRVLAVIDWRTARLVVEYGPGVGTFTRPILARLAPEARLIAIDTNADFVRHLRARIGDPRFAAVHGSAADVSAILADRGDAPADHIVSGLPFSTLPPGLGDAIAAATHEALRPGGGFHVYQFSAYAKPLLQRHFPRIEQASVWRNVPPARVLHAYRA